MQLRNITILFFISLLAAIAFLDSSARAETFNAAQGSTPDEVSTDPYKPVSRGYIEPSIEDLGHGKYRIRVKGNYTSPNTGVRLSLQAVINDGENNSPKLVELKELAPQGTNFNPLPSSSVRQLYRSDTSYVVTEEELNKLMKEAFPNAEHARIGPGAQLFVHSKFDIGHRWGGTDRGGGITIPGTPKETASLPAASQVTAIDVHYPQRLIAASSIGTGLDPDGSIGSKVEMEGKWAVKDEAAFRKVQDNLMAISKNPDMTDANGKRILPEGWTIKLEDRYVLRDPKAVTAANPEGYVLDKRGMPIADPMRDTASDTKDFKLAKSDSILRARHTEQNNTTVINAKPGGVGYVVDNDGIVQRVEFSAAVSGGDPSSAKAFFESKHPLNFMQAVSAESGVKDPAEALQIKSVQQMANRLKFMLSGPNGEIIEVSTDHVHAKSLVNPNSAPVEYFQMEADFEHRAVTGSISSRGATNSIDSYSTPIELAKLSDPVAGPKLKMDLTMNFKRDKNGKIIYSRDAAGNTIKDASFPGGYRIELGAPNTFNKAFLDGRPSLHSVESLQPNSAFMRANGAEFDKAKAAMVAVRDYAIGKDEWVSAANKIAMSNFLLGHFSEDEASTSVKRQLAEMRSRGWISNSGVVRALFNCASAYGKFTQ